MIILSQEKTYLVNFNNVCQITLAIDEEETEYAIMVETVDKEEIIMGVYQTEERAKEVLKEIVKQYKELITSYQKGSSDYPIETLIFNRNVYEMPEE